MRLAKLREARCALRSAATPFEERQLPPSRSGQVANGDRDRVLNPADDDLEPEIPAWNSPERLEDIGSKSIDLRGRVEIGDRRLAVEYPVALRYAGAEHQRGQANRLNALFQYNF
jgi:hypothetical protein